MTSPHSTLAWWLSTAIVFGVILVTLSASVRGAIARGIAGHIGKRRLDRFRAREAEILAGEGGSPDFPIVVDTPAVIDVRAQGKPCPLCGGKLRFEEQIVERHEGQLLRCTLLECVACGVPRRFWFRVGPRPVDPSEA